MQVVVSSRLAEEGLKLLAKGCTKEELLKYAEKVIANGDENVRTNAGTVVKICLNINKRLDKEIKEDERTSVSCQRKRYAGWLRH